MKEKKKRVWSPVHSAFFTYVGSKHERQEKTNLESEAASSDDAGSADQAESNTSTTES